MHKKTLGRFSLSMSSGLVEQLDGMCKAKGYESRSQAVADMVRGRLVEHQALASARETAGM